MSSNITISIAKKESDKERCGYCFAGILDEEVWVCEACETSLHRECYDELQSCITMGCRNKTHSSDDLAPHNGGPRRRRPRRARRAPSSRSRSGRQGPLSPEARFFNIIGLIFLTLILIVLVPITITVLFTGMIAFGIAAFSGDISALIGITIGFGLSSVILVLLSILLIKTFRRIMRDLQR